MTSTPPWDQQALPPPGYPPQNYPPGYGPPAGYGPPPGYGPPAGYEPAQPYQQAPPRKRHHVFRWVFLAIQVIFIIWIIAGLASNGSGPTVAQQVAQQCGNGGWQGLFKSYGDCTVHYGHALNDATDTGKGLGVALVIVAWCVVDFLVGGTYAIWRLSTRSRR
jgi:hypothetical protein